MINWLISVVFSTPIACQRRPAVITGTGTIAILPIASQAPHELEIFHDR